MPSRARTLAFASGDAFFHNRVRMNLPPLLRARGRTLLFSLALGLFLCGCATAPDSGWRAREDIMPDLLHLSPKGYQIWADSIEEKLKDLLGEK